MRDFIEEKMGEKNGTRLKTAILQLILGKMMNWVTNELGSGLGLAQLKRKIKKETRLLRFELMTGERRAWTRARHVADAWVVNRFADRVAGSDFGSCEKIKGKKGHT